MSKPRRVGYWARQGAYRGPKGRDYAGKRRLARALQRHIREFMGLGGEYVGPIGFTRMERNGDGTPPIVCHDKIAILSHLDTITGGLPVGIRPALT